MRIRHRNNYEARQKKLKAQKEARTKSLDALIANVDKFIASALKGGAYHSGEMQDLNDARHSLMTVRGGASRRVMR